MKSFDTTGEAYDASQCDDSIAKGDTLVIQAEGVVALAWVWPTAVTVAAGELHSVEEGFDPAEIIEDAGWSAEQIAAAVAFADSQGFPVAAWARP